MSSNKPKRELVYQNHHLDSTHWDYYKPRTGDVVVSTAIKSGTTWVQSIVLNLIFLGKPAPSLWDFSPWLDARLTPIQPTIQAMEAQENRRLIKSHLPIDAVPFYENVNYIIVGRDPRDVFMSLWNHYSNYTPGALEHINNSPGRVGEALPSCPPDIHDFWRDWVSKGWFSWEREGYPFWGNMRHSQSWWDFRGLENILFVHFNDLQNNLAAEIARIADFLSVDMSAQDVVTVMEAVGLSKLRQNPNKINPVMGWIWSEGAKTFFFKGTNGRWKDLLSEAELTQYQMVKAEILSKPCAEWLENGRQ